MGWPPKGHLSRELNEVRGQATHMSVRQTELYVFLLLWGLYAALLFIWIVPSSLFTLPHLALLTRGHIFSAPQLCRRGLMSVVVDALPSGGNLIIFQVFGGEHHLEFIAN